MVLSRSNRQVIAGAAVALLVCASAAGAPASRSPTHPDRYAQAVLAAHPVGYWHFDDPTASRRAASAGSGPAGRYVRTRRVGGVVGSARAFDGLSSYLTIPDSPAWSQPATGALTVEFWMRPKRRVFPREQGSGYVWVLGKGEPGRQEWGFRMYGLGNRESPARGNRIAFYAFNPQGGEGAGAYFQDPIVPGRWLYVVGELTRTGVRIYRDGALRQGPPARATLYANPAYRIVPESGSAPVRAGTRNLHSFFAGAIDELAIYPRLLSGAEIRRHYRLALTEHPALAIAAPRAAQLHRSVARR